MSFEVFGNNKACKKEVHLDLMDLINLIASNNNPHVKRAVFTLPYKGVYHTTTLKGHQKRLTTAIFTLAYPLKGSLYSLVDRLSSIISSFS